MRKSQPVSPFVGQLARFAADLVVGGTNTGTLPCETLLDQVTISADLQRLAMCYPKSSRQAIVVLRARAYSTKLLGALVIPALMLNRRIPQDIQECRVAFEDGSKLPSYISVRECEGTFDSNDPFDRFNDLVWNHLEPFIVALATHGRTSYRILWGNIAFHFERTVDATVTQARELGLNLSCNAYDLFNRKSWPDGQPNPLFEPWHSFSGEPAYGQRFRKTCCLYYKLHPDNPLCRACPINMKRQKSQS